MSRASIGVMSASERATAAARAAFGPALALRPYQRKAIAAIGASVQRRQIVALPTGKTIIFAHAIRDVVCAGGRAIVLVHRDKLVTQTLEKLAVVAPALVTTMHRRRQLRTM